MRCYYYGYVACHIIGGSLAYHFGFKRVLLYSSIVGALLSIGFPFFVRQSYGLGIAARVLLGIMQSAWFPAIQGLNNYRN